MSNSLKKRINVFIWMFKLAGIWVQARNANSMIYKSGVTLIQLNAAALPGLLD